VTLTQRVNRILREDWDPIGCGVPDDEYATYAANVATLIRRADTRSPALFDAIFSYLEHVETEVITCRVSRFKRRMVTGKLMGLHETP
jgi:hypothetical protein